MNRKELLATIVLLNDNIKEDENFNYGLVHCLYEYMGSGLHDTLVRLLSLERAEKIKRENRLLYVLENTSCLIDKKHKKVPIPYILDYLQETFPKGITGHHQEAIDTYKRLKVVVLESDIIKDDSWAKRHNYYNYIKQLQNEM